MICRYYITIEGERKLLERTDLKNWGDVEYSLSRSDFSGIVRSFSSSFEFVGDAAKLIRNSFEKNNLFANVSIEVQTMENDHTFKPAFSCPLDFATYEEVFGIVKINAIDNSLSAIIKANKGKKYDFLMSEFTDSKSMPFLYRGIELDNMVSYKIGETNEKTQRVEFTTLDGGEYQKLPVTIVNSDVVDSRGLSWTNQPQEVFTVKSYPELGEAGVVPSEHGFPYGSYTNGDYKFLTYEKTDDGFVKSADVRVYMDVDFVIPGNVSEFDVWVCTATPTGDVVNYPNESQSVAMYQLKKDTNGHYVLDNKHFTLHSSYRMMLVAHIVSAGTAKIEVNSCTFYATWPGYNKPSYIDYVKPISLLNKLVKSMVDNRMECSCEIEGATETYGSYSYSDLGSWDTDGRLANTILVPKDAITNNPLRERFIRTSFTEFCKWMETVYGYIYRVEGEKIIFCHRTKVFTESDLEPYEIENANDLNLKVNQKVVISEMEIGYEPNEEDAFNMKYEYNRKATYDTGLINTEKKMSLISPYRADSVGFELAYRSGLETLTDDKSSQDGIWCVLIKQEIEEGAQIITPDTDIQLDRLSEVKGGMFNFYFAPVYCLKANSRYLSSFFSQLKLTSSNVNNIKIDSDFGYLEMKRDFMSDADDCSFFSKRLMSNCILSFVTNVQALPSDLSKPVSVTSNGYRYVGYIQDISAKYEREESADYKLIVKQKIKI